MATEDDCRGRADANLVLARKLAADGQLNWAIVLVFYAAVFDVNRLLVRGAKYSDDMDHTWRNTYVSDYHPAIDSTYREMLGASIKCRYLPTHVATQTAFQRQVTCYDRVRDYVDRALAGTIPGVAF